MPRPAEHRKVQERSVATRAKLLDAAIDSLVERGYAETTTIETARRARVSRGAQQHHFATKSALLGAAVERLFDRRLAEFRQAFAALDPEADRLDAALDLLWSMFQGPTFIAWTELRVAARTDSDLAATIVAVEHRFTTETRTLFIELFPPGPDADQELYAMARDFAFALMDGVAVQYLFKGGGRPPTTYLDALKHVFRLARLEG